MEQKLNKAVSAIRKKTDFVPSVAVILGSGLGRFAENIDVKCEIGYSEIPGMPVSTNPAHKGSFIFGSFDGIEIVCMNGRIHYYEGYSMQEVVMPVRVMGMLGAKSLILTNAAGGIRNDLNPGDFMMIKDHISCYVPSPLVGKNINFLGSGFVDMSYVYDPDIISRVKEAGKAEGIDVKEGVYLQTTGPQYETPAEIIKFEKDGADAVGMSTACEAIAARQMGMKIAGISCITNKAAGKQAVISDDEVTTVAGQSFSAFSKLLDAAVKAAFSEE